MRYQKRSVSVARSARKRKGPYTIRYCKTDEENMLNNTLSKIKGKWSKSETVTALWQVNRVDKARAALTDVSKKAARDRKRSLTI